MKPSTTNPLKEDLPSPSERLGKGHGAHAHCEANEKSLHYAETSLAWRDQP